MALTISTKTYSFDTNKTPDSAVYVGPAQTATVKDQVILKRMAPKPTKDFAGVVRCVEKTVKSVVIGTGATAVTRDVIAETTFSYPVGTDAATVTALRVDHKDLLANACTQTLLENAKLNY